MLKFNICQCHSVSIVDPLEGWGRKICRAEFIAIPLGAQICHGAGKVETDSIWSLLCLPREGLVVSGGICMGGETDQFYHWR